MKKHIKTCLLLLFGAISSMTLALSPDELAEAVSYAVNADLLDAHDAGSSFRQNLSSGRWTTDEALSVCADAIVFFRKKDDDISQYGLENAVRALGSINSDEAFELAITLATNTTGAIRSAALESCVELSFSSEFRKESLKNFLTDSPHADRKALSVIYTEISNELLYGAPDRAKQRVLVSFLLHRSSVETNLIDRLDNILIREVPLWRASSKRAANAERMLREHPDDPALTNFFSHVLSDVRAQPAFIASANRLLDAKLSGPKIANATATGKEPDEDPWADLLVDLPEKKPWEPPQEMPDPAQ